MSSVIYEISQPITAAQSSYTKESESQTQEKESAVNQIDTTYDSVSSQGDTLSISEVGKAASTNDGGILVSKSEDDGIVLQKANESSDEESGSNSTVNLSIYTEIELKQMYLDGDITKIEYDDELNSREVTK